MKQKLIQPTYGKLISKFAVELAKEIKDKNTIFFRAASKDIIEIGKIKLKKDDDETYTGFLTIPPNRFITLIEKYVIPGVESWNPSLKKIEFKEKSINSQLASTLIASEIIQKALPPINRIFTIPVPIIHDNQLTFPIKGYDERFCSWLSYDTPGITKPDMKLSLAKKIIEYIFKEFCFTSPRDKTNAIAALITPYLRGLFKTFNTRTPVFFYLANRERAGKDYCAGITGILYEEYALEEPPISSSENSKSNHTEELRKKILAAMIHGRKRLHFSNNKGYIDNALFEGIITAPRWSDRLLGKNELLKFDNEMDFSLSGNIGVSFTPDLANRCRFIRLLLDVEDANSRKFKNPNLHEWVREHRDLILSALYCFVKNWIKKGMPPGKIPFASFPEWARVCGGIMESAGYDNPCMPDPDTLRLGGDSETMDMKKLFEECYETYPEQWINTKHIKAIVQQEDSDIFPFLDFTKKSDQILFGNKIIKFSKRILSDIKLNVKDESIRPSRREYIFTKGGGN